jgi:hypothetical protein
MKALRRFGTLGIAMIVAVASLMLGATPASAAGDTHYENVGNPGWCLDGNGTEAYLHRCGHDQIDDFQMWTVGNSGVMKVKHKETGACLKSWAFNVSLSYCGDLGTNWYVNGKNGWVKFVNLSYSPEQCLMPTGTGQGGLSRYPLIVDWCDPNDHTANPRNIHGNVPNILAWRWIP